LILPFSLFDFGAILHLTQCHAEKRQGPDGALQQASTTDSQQTAE